MFEHEGRKGGRQREGYVLFRSTGDGCANYEPDENKLTGLRSKDVGGLMSYECLNFKFVKNGSGYDCGFADGEINYCSEHKIQRR